MNRALLIALTVAIAAAAAPAYAQSDGDSEEIRLRYDAAVGAYRDGEFAEAARAYLDVYRLSGAPVLLYNAAYAFGRAGKYERAVEEGRRARREGLDGADTTARNEARLAAWNARESAAAQAVVVRTLPRDLQVPERRSGVDWRIVGGSVLGAAGVSAFIASVFVAMRIEAQKETLRSNVADRNEAAYDDTLNAIGANQDRGKALLVGGTVLTVGASALLYYGVRF